MVEIPFGGSGEEGRVSNTFGVTSGAEVRVESGEAKRGLKLRSMTGKARVEIPWEGVKSVRRSRFRAVR